MSLTPNPEPPSLEANATGAVPQPTKGHSRLWGMIFAILTLEIGLFLVIYPWMDAWNLNHLPAQLRNYLQNSNPFGLSLEDLWDDPYFRGAVSGLGLINLWICLREVVRLVRPAA